MTNVMETMTIIEDTLKGFKVTILYATLYEKGQKYRFDELAINMEEDWTDEVYDTKRY